MIYSDEAIAMTIKTARIALTSAALLGAMITTAYAYQGAQYAKDATLTMAQARAQALKLAPGTIKDAELEKESGGSGLRYSFDIQTPKGLREVGIDAITGKVLENSTESAKGEAAETQSEHKAKNGQSGHETTQSSREPED